MIISINKYYYYVLQKVCLKFYFKYLKIKIHKYLK